MYEGSELLGSELSIGGERGEMRIVVSNARCEQLNIKCNITRWNDIEKSFFQTSGFMVRGE